MTALEVSSSGGVSRRRNVRGRGSRGVHAGAQRSAAREERSHGVRDGGGGCAGRRRFAHGVLTRLRPSPAECRQTSLRPPTQLQTPLELLLRVFQCPWIRSLCRPFCSGYKPSFWKPRLKTRHELLTVPVWHSREGHKAHGLLTINGLLSSTVDINAVPLVTGVSRRQRAMHSHPEPVTQSDAGRHLSCGARGTLGDPRLLRLEQSWQSARSVATGAGTCAAWSRHMTFLDRQTRSWQPETASLMCLHLQMPCCVQSSA